MNHTIPIMKAQSSNYKNHLTPIAPAPLIAPKPPPVQVLPKPLSKTSSSTTISSQNSNGSNSTIRGLHPNDEDTKSLPCIITSKQWVLPPRPKAGRKPSVEKPNHTHKLHRKLSSSTMNTSNSSSSMSSLSNNMVGLNLQRSSSEVINLNNDLSSANIIKSQLETATEENQKLKNIISRLKSEIDSLSKPRQSPLASDFSSPPSFPMDLVSSTTPPNTSNLTTATTSTNTTVSTPITTLTSREVSPTVDPKFIGMGQAQPQPRTKRPYRKKKKSKKDLLKEQQEAAEAEALKAKENPAVTVKTEDSPSPIALGLINEKRSITELPKLEQLIDSGNSLIDMEEALHPAKKTKTIKLERSLSLQTQDLLMSPPSSNFNHTLDRSSSHTLDSFEFNLHTNNLSRTTTITTIDNEFNWDRTNSCGFCADGSPCLCIEEEQEQYHNEAQQQQQHRDINNKEFHNEFNKDNLKQDVINETDELDMSFFIKEENDEPFNLMI